MMLIVNALFFLPCCICAQSQDNFDPFVEAEPVGSLSEEVDGGAPPKVITRFMCIGRGALTGKELNDRIDSIMTAIADFYDAYERTPAGIDELRAFCGECEMELHDLKSLSAVEFEDGQFSCSAGYGEGTLHLTHRLGAHGRFDLLAEEPEAE